MSKKMLRLSENNNAYAITSTCSNSNFVITAKLVSRRLLSNLLQELEALLRCDIGILYPVDQRIEFLL